MYGKASKNKVNIKNSALILSYTFLDRVCLHHPSFILIIAIKYSSNYSVEPYKLITILIYTVSIQTPQKHLLKFYTFLTWQKDLLIVYGLTSLFSLCLLRSILNNNFFFGYIDMNFCQCFTIQN